MSISKYRNSKTGIVYCYESVAVWDRERKQSRPQRTYLGRWDETTQSIIPTEGKRGRKKSQPAAEAG